MVGAVLRRASLTPARKWIVGWSAFLVASDSLVLALALAGRNNHWMTYIATPVEAGLVLWAQSLWQLSPLSARVMRVTIPVLWVGWVVIVLLVEDIRTFSLLAQPIQSLVLMGPAIGTLVMRTFREPGRLREQDWLWIGVGVVVHFASSVALPPASYLLLTKSPRLVVRAYEVRGALNILAFALIARGFFCPARKGPAAA